MGYERTSDDPQTPRQKNHRRSTPDDQEKMRALRRAGLGLEAIAAQTGFSLSVVHQHAGHIKLPKKGRAWKPVASDRNITKLEREQRKATDQYDLDYQPPTSSRPLPQGRAYTPQPKSWRFHFDPDARYDTSGPRLDPDLINHAESILEQWAAGTVKGRLYERRINVNQAALIYASSIPLWDYDSFLEHREMWRAVRALSGVNSTELAARLDISPASISRYEKKTRNPPALLMRDIHAAYTGLLEEALTRAEWCLVIDSWADAVTAETGIPYDEITDTIDDVHAWVAQGTDLEGFTIEHIEHLATVRRWMPYPEWREPTVNNLWLVGYTNAQSLQPA